MSHTHLVIARCPDVISSLEKIVAQSNPNGSLITDVDNLSKCGDIDIDRVGH